MSASEAAADGFFLEWLNGSLERTEAVAELAFALEGRTPAELARERLLSAAESPELRWAPLFGRLGAFLKLPEPELVDIARRASEERQWLASPLPGVRLLHFSPGAELAVADAGLVWVQPGLSFPDHLHLGEERALILEGSARDSSGRLLRPGDIQLQNAGSSHAFEVLPGRPLVYALVLFDQVDVGGIRFPSR